MSDAFEAHRALLFGIAYRMLGSVAEAEDVLQEVHLRWLSAEREALESPRAWLVTVTSRRCLDALGSARARRERYVGPWLPEPVATDEGVDPERVSMAFLLLLERASPAERAAFLLAEVFEYSFAEVAAVLHRSEEACRQLASRARRHVREGRGRAVDPAVHERALAGFLAACASGDLAGLEAQLARDAVVRSDGGGVAKAARRPVVGANRAARMLVGLARRGASGGAVGLRVERINGQPAAVLCDAEGAPRTVLSLWLDEAGLVREVHLVTNPEKLRLAARLSA